MIAMLLASSTVSAQADVPNAWSEAIRMKLDALKRKAASGNKFALLELGRRYESGEGMPIDLVQAARAYAQAGSDSGGTRMIFVPSGNGAVISVPISQGPNVKGLPVARAWLARLCTRNSIDIGTCAAILEHKDDNKLSSLLVKPEVRDNGGGLPAAAANRNGPGITAFRQNDMLSTSDFVSRHVRYSLAFDDCARSLGVPESLWTIHSSSESGSDVIRRCILLTLSTGPICPEGYNDELNSISSLEGSDRPDNILGRSFHRAVKTNRCLNDTVAHKTYTSSLLKTVYHLDKPTIAAPVDNPANRYLEDLCRIIKVGWSETFLPEEIELCLISGEKF